MFLILINIFNFSYRRLSGRNNDTFGSVVILGLRMYKIRSLSICDESLLPQTHVGEERKPSLTDEEEFGSSTSSCDKMSGMALLADSDTASAGSPSHP